MKYRKKPIVVEAEVYREGLEDDFDTIVASGKKYLGWPVKRKNNEIVPIDYALVPYINTLEGKHYISKGDYIITGVKGERYPCKPDIFKATYEPVEE